MHSNTRVYSKQLVWSKRTALFVIEADPPLARGPAGQTHIDFPVLSEDIGTAQYT